MDYDKKYNEAVEKVCGTCTYWQEGTLDRGQCQAGEPHQTHSAETCERWERHEEIPIKEQPCEDLKKETIERAVAWLKEHANDYIVDLTPTYPDAPSDIIIGGKCWEDLKKAMEGEK